MDSLNAIFRQAEEILKMDRPGFDNQPEDQSDWEHFIPPENDHTDHVPPRWKYEFHPPVSTKGEPRMIVCENCNCQMLRLAKLYQDVYPYWCLHCGPQKTIMVY